MRIARVSFGSDVHGEFFLHKNVLLLWEKGFVQSPASLGAGSDRDLFQARSCFVFYISFLSHSFSWLPFPCVSSFSFSSVCTGLLFALGSKDAMRSPPLPGSASP